MSDPKRMNYANLEDGDTVFHNDGSWSEVAGSKVYHSDGSWSEISGSRVYHSDGTTSDIIGDTTFHNFDDSWSDCEGRNSDGSWDD